VLSCQKLKGPSPKHTKKKKPEKAAARPIKEEKSTKGNDGVVDKTLHRGGHECHEKTVGRRAKTKKTIKKKDFWGPIPLPKAGDRKHKKDSPKCKRGDKNNGCGRGWQTKAFKRNVAREG